MNTFAFAGGILEGTTRRLTDKDPETYENGGFLRVSARTCWNQAHSVRERISISCESDGIRLVSCDCDCCHIARQSCRDVGTKGVLA